MGDMRLLWAVVLLAAADESVDESVDESAVALFFASHVVDAMFEFLAFAIVVLDNGIRFFVRKHSK